MKTVTALSLALATVAHAHYTFPYYISSTGNVTGEWEYVRETANHYSQAPVTDVNDTSIACYQLTSGDEGAETASVTAGDTVGFKLDSDIGHPGPLQFYMAKAPTGDSASTMNGSDSDVKWFKIWHDEANITSDSISWPNEGKTEVTVQIPSCIEDGDYMLRVEQIALHGAESYGGAQFYLACAQMTVTGGGSYVAETGDYCTFPGCYTGYESGILIDIYYPIPTSYTYPGPDVITCSGSSASSSSSAVASSAVATSTVAATSAAAPSSTGSASDVTGNAATGSSSSSSCASKRKRRSQHKFRA